VTVDELDDAVCGALDRRRQHEEPVRDAERRNDPCRDGGKRANGHRAIVIGGSQLWRG
jgi:hypothetical protein